MAAGCQPGGVDLLPAFLLAVVLMSATPGPAMALVLRQVAVETALYLGLAWGAGRAAGWFRRPRVRRGLDAAMGTVLVGLGLRVAGASR